MSDQFNAPLIYGNNEVLTAYAEALNAIEHIIKTQTADTGKYIYHYADLGDVLDECKRVAGKFGLSISQVPAMEGDLLAVYTTLILVAEGRDTATLTFAPIRLRMPTDAQALGSALTYLRRYSLMTIFGIAPEDDDGATATRSARQASTAPPQQPVQDSEAVALHKRLREVNPESALAEELRALVAEERRGLKVTDLSDAEWRAQIIAVIEVHEQDDDDADATPAATEAPAGEEPF